MGKNSNTILLVSGQFVSKLGTTLFNMACSWWVVAELGSSDMLGIVMAISLTPVVLLSPFSGAVTDMMRKKKVIVVSDFLSGLVSILFVLFFTYSGYQVISLMISSFFLGVISAFFEPAIKSIIPSVVDSGQIHKMNSQIAIAHALPKVMAPFIGAVFIDHIGYNGLFLMNGISFLFSGVSEIFIRERAILSTKKITVRSVLKNMHLGYLCIMRNSAIKFLFVWIIVVNFFIASVDVLLPYLVKTNLKFSLNGYSNMLVVQSISAILSSFFFSKFIQFKNLKYLFVFSIVLSLLMVGAISFFYFSYSLYIFAFFWGGGQVLFNTYIFTYIQLGVKKRHLGKVFSALFTLAILLTPLAYIMYGFLGSQNPIGIIVIAGSSLFIISIATYVYRAMKNKERIILYE